MNYTKMGRNNEEYNKYVEAKAKKSNILKNCLMAFLIGGAICVLGQFITNIGINNGLDKKTASCITSICLIFIAAFLTAIRVFHKIGKVAGAGTIVPITGFSNSIVFKVAGPVLVYGIGSSVIVGLIYWLGKYVF